LHSEDGSEFTRIDAEHFRERPPGCLKEDRVKRAVILKEAPNAFGDSKDGMAMRDVFDNLAVNMLSELHRSFSPAGGADPTAFARERNKQ
jgi:hypothetical protein